MAVSDWNTQENDNTGSEEDATLNQEYSPLAEGMEMWGRGSGFMRSRTSSIQKEEGEITCCI